MFSNNSRDDQTLALRFFSAFAGSGLGFRCNSQPEVVYVRDRTAWLDSIREALAQAPPTVVMPAHGAPLTQNAAARTERAADALNTSLQKQETLSARAAYLLVLALLWVARLLRPRQAVR
jgi:glyoxylase-like metal-dependent hydrolase (beta-lactamase superfamily II)